MGKTQFGPFTFTTDGQTIPGEALSFTVTAALLNKAQARKGDWKTTADHWSVTLRSVEYGGEAVFDYWIGVGHRALPRTESDIFARGVLRFDEDSAKGFLSSIGSDLLTLSELPAETGAAMDYLADERGGFDKPSEALRIVEALRCLSDRVKRVLANTGIGVEDFTSWASELEN